MRNTIFAVSCVGLLLSADALCEPVDDGARPHLTSREQADTLESAPGPQPGKMVSLAGDFHITRRDGMDYVTIAAPEPGSAARSRTELALKCWLGLVGYQGCWKGGGGCNPVERVKYLGRTAAGADAYRVRYRYKHAAYGVGSDARGNANQYWVKATDHYWIKREISPRITPVLVYERPKNAPLLDCRPYFPSGTMQFP